MLVTIHTGGVPAQKNRVVHDMCTVCYLLSVDCFELPVPSVICATGGSFKLCTYKSNSGMQRHIIGNGLYDKDYLHCSGHLLGCTGSITEECTSFVCTCFLTSCVLVLTMTPFEHAYVVSDMHS